MKEVLLDTILGGFILGSIFIYLIYMESQIYIFIKF